MKNDKLTQSVNIRFTEETAKRLNRITAARILISPTLSQLSYADSVRELVEKALPLIEKELGIIK